MATPDDLRTKLVPSFGEIIAAIRSQYDPMVKGLADGSLSARDEYLLPMRLTSLLKDLPTLFRRAKLQDTPLDTLSVFRPSGAQAKVITDLAKLLDKSHLRVPSKNIEALATFYLKTMLTLIKGFDVMLAVVRRPPHEVSERLEDTLIPVGSFKMKNVGDFKPKALDLVGKAILGAERGLRAKGLGKVCYGDIQIVKSVSGKSSVLAFYRIADDSLFIRGNVRDRSALQNTITHELAHRLDYKFLSSKKRDIDALYAELKNSASNKFNSAEWPGKGSEIEVDGRKFVVDGYAPNGKLIVSEGTNKFTMGYQGVFHLMNPTFVTPYAATDPRENFAEMINYYCQGKLPEDQIAPLRAIIG
jgi:hypothetical protein